ncbi:spore coat protein U domain-containing protein [Bacteriovorax sp. Seq25_V]|uniref:spore coat protein U domain-containing protein n=1 Tax=Bacteriovorax sp. Seq25_V TaxID=1201288 RepID=UPI0018DFFF9A|nr:spore coat protein U domain-containing protein [Bacteriovorax sp. Seq25_V]
MDLNSYQETTPLNLSMQRTRVSYDFLCNFYFYDFGKGNANSYQRYLENKNGDKISYNLYKINGYKNILTELSDMKQNSDAIWGWSLATNQNYQDSFNVILSYDRSLIYPAGNYTDSVPVRIYSGLPFNDPRRESSSNLFLTFSIPSSIALSLVDAGSPFSEGDTTQTMDFGEIETGDTLEADLKVRSNAGYRIYMRSDNRGSLKHQLLNDKITYVLTVNNRSVNLKRGGKGDKVADFSGVTPHDGDNLRLKVVMGNPQSVQAGTYTDYVTITAETKD